MASRIVALLAAVIIEIFSFFPAIGYAHLHLEICEILGLGRLEISTMACSVKSQELNRIAT